ncbi:MAG: hypothetical protein ABUL55_02495 [Pseudomonadota bacterium]
MKTLIISISDQAAEQLAKSAAEGRRSEEEVASYAVEAAFSPDWYDELDDEARAAIAESEAEADRGEFATADEIAEAFDRFRR